MMVSTMGATTSREVATLLLGDVRVDLADERRPDFTGSNGEINPIVNTALAPEKPFGTMS